MNENRFKNQLGEDYDLFSLVLPHQGAIQKQSVLALKKSVNSPHPNILEIGFGTGITTKEILISFKQINLTSIDSEPEMILKAKQKLEDSRLNSSCLVILDAKSFLEKQEDNSFDGIISVWTIHNLFKDEQKEVLQEVFRVLKPGGVFVNGDKIVVDDLAQYKKDFEWQIKQFDLFLDINREDLYTLWKDHYEEDAVPSRKITEKEYENLLKGFGFSSISFTERSHLDIVCIAIK